MGDWDGRSWLQGGGVMVTVQWLDRQLHQKNLLDGIIRGNSPDHPLLSPHVARSTKVGSEWCELCVQGTCKKAGQ